jgi:septum site-determining protein MinC
MMVMNTEKRVNVQIKGVRDGLLVTLGDGEWGELQSALLGHIQERAAFFQGARVALDVGNHILHAAELGNLRDRLSEMGISLWAILSNSPTTEQTAQVLGLATKIFTPRPDRTIKAANTGHPDGEAAIFVQRTLRSGMRVSFQGNVIVMGDVNPGAEVIASGSIIVWGRLKGTVHAGAEGNDKAIVCALELHPTQLRIGSVVSVTPEKRGKLQPETARVENGQVVANPWDTKEGGR